MTWHVGLAGLAVTIGSACGTSDSTALLKQVATLEAKALACKDAPCAKAVQAEMQTLTANARDLDQPAARTLFATASRVEVRVADLEANPPAPTALVIARGPALTRAEIWTTMEAACTLAFVDPKAADARTAAKAGLGMVGLSLPPDLVVTGDAARDRAARTQWHGELAFDFLKAMSSGTKTTGDVVVFAMVEHNACVVFHAYEPTPYFTKLADLMEANAKEAGIHSNAEPVIALLRKQAPAAEVHAAAERLLAEVRTAMAPVGAPGAPEAAGGR